MVLLSSPGGTCSAGLSSASRRILRGQAALIRKVPGKAEIHFNIILPVIPLVIADQIGADLIHPLCRIRLLKGLTPFGFPDEFHPVKPISKQSVSKLVLSYYVNGFCVNNKNQSPMIRQ
jgi:hypothetical protein